MDGKPRTLCDAEISSTRALNRRSLIAALGLGVGLVAAVAAGAVTTQAQQAPPPKPERRDPCRDSDHGPSDTDGCGKPPIS